jgi:predicted lipid-binding transport protein (Tim44 family)
MLFQIAILGLVVWLAMKLFRRRQQPAMAGYGAAREPLRPEPVQSYSSYTPATPAPASSLEITIDASDRREFERLLIEVQDAYAHEDYAALRERTTPEVMSYLAEELSQNATQGRRNDVTGTRLLEADVAEAWREGEVEYATAALRYESIDIMRDRQTGAVLEGDPNQPTQETELWTFVRRPGSQWKLSAIQETN